MRYFLMALIFVIVGCGSGGSFRDVSDQLRHGPLDSADKECLRKQRELARPQYESALNGYNERLYEWQSCDNQYGASYRKWSNCMSNSNLYKSGACGAGPVYRCGNRPNRPDLDDFVDMRYCN